MPIKYKSTTNQMYVENQIRKFKSNAHQMASGIWSPFDGHLTHIWLAFDWHLICLVWCASSGVSSEMRIIRMLIIAFHRNSRAISQSANRTRHRTSDTPHPHPSDIHRTFDGLPLAVGDCRCGALICLRSDSAGRWLYLTFIKGGGGTCAGRFKFWCPLGISFAHTCTQHKLNKTAHYNNMAATTIWCITSNAVIWADVVKPRWWTRSQHECDNKCASAM